MKLEDMTIEELLVKLIHNSATFLYFEKPEIKQQILSRFKQLEKCRELMGKNIEGSYHGLYVLCDCKGEKPMSFKRIIKHFMEQAKCSTK